MRSYKVAVAGSGMVSQALAAGFKKHGHSVVLTSRSVEKLKKFSDENSLEILPLDKALVQAEIVVLAVKGSGAEEFVKNNSALLKNKIVIDVTNPIADLPPVNGVLQFFTGPNDSLMERLQKLAPEAQFVKSFSCVGNAFMVNPPFADKPTMFIAGNSDDAKLAVKEILTQFGWESEDMGTAEAARAIEPLCMLWCIPGFKSNSWTHAFKLLKL